MKHAVLCMLILGVAGLGLADGPVEGAEVAKPMTQEAPQEAPQEDQDDDVAGKVDSMGEAFTELKNIVDALNRLKISAYFQAQWVDDEASTDQLTSPTATRNRNQFSVRRGRIKLVYTANPTARATVAFDTASSGVTLKDAFIELTEPWTTWKNTITAGQFNWPFGFEIGYSSSDREMPERSRVVRTLFPGERDRGAMISGLGMMERLSYKVALVNGTGTSQSFDFNSDKDLVGRLGGTVGPLDLGASIYRGEDLVATSTVPTGASFDKEREGIDFQLITPVPGLGLRGEYISGKERGADVDGWYAYLVQNLGTRHQLIVRADDYDPNKDLANNATMTLGGAYIFHWDANAKVMFAYEHPELETKDPDDDVTTIRVQYKF